jgi:phosphoenolpyruvate carboxykinase (ATP)
MSDIAPFRDAVPLAGTGVRVAAALHANLTAPALVAHSLRKGEGRLSADGAIIVRTGVHTGRSVGDKFVVDEPSTTGQVWWGKINQKLPAAKYAVLKGRVQAYMQGRELFTQDLYAGADPANRIRVRLVTSVDLKSVFE